MDIELKNESLNYKSLVLNERQIFDLEMILNGGFAPLNCFLNRDDYESVLSSMRLKNGSLWPIPINLDVNKEFSRKINPGDKLTLKDRTTLANMTQDELILLHNTLGQYIREKFFWLWKGNPGLINACREVTGEDCQNEDDACVIIIRELWKKLRETHKLRVVK